MAATTASLPWSRPRTTKRPLTRDPVLSIRTDPSQRQALRVVKMSVLVYLYGSVGRDVEVLKMRIREITNARVN